VQVYLKGSKQQPRPAYKILGRHTAVPAGIRQPRPVFRSLGRSSSVQAGIERTGRHSSQPAGVTSCWAGISPSGISTPRWLLGQADSRASRLDPSTGSSIAQESSSPQRYARQHALVPARLVDPRRDRSSPLLDFHQGQHLGSFPEEVQRQGHMAIVPWYKRQDKLTRQEETTIGKQCCTLCTVCDTWGMAHVSPTLPLTHLYKRRRRS
jgi:hypothetical protein